jgi:GNAT superfamily N-acetyltransferase
MGAGQKMPEIVANRTNASVEIALSEQPMRAKKGVGNKAVRGETFDIARVKNIGVFNDVVLFGQLDCYREDSRAGLVLDGQSLRTRNKKFVSGLCRLTITVEGVVYDGRMSQGMLQRERLGLRSRTRQEDRLRGFVGYEKQLKEIENTLYSQIAFVDCDVIFSTGTSLDEMRDSIEKYTIDTEEMLLDLAAVDLVETYKSTRINACCLAISRLYIHPAFRKLGLSSWLLRNLPVLGQTVVNMPVGDMLLIPGDFSNESRRQHKTKREYVEWLKEYYEKNGFLLENDLTIKGIYRNNRISV